MQGLERGSADGWAFDYDAAADIKNVDTVIIGGAIRKFRGKLAGVNMTKFRQQVDESRNYLFQQAGYKLDIFSS